MFNECRIVETVGDVEKEKSHDESPLRSQLSVIRNSSLESLQAANDEFFRKRREYLAEIARREYLLEIARREGRYEEQG